MLTLIKLYVFDGIEHTPEDPVEDLERDAVFITEKIADVPVAISLKSRNEQQKNKPENEEIIKIIEESGNYELLIECQTLNFVKYNDKGEYIWK